VRSKSLNYFTITPPLSSVILKYLLQPAIMQVSDITAVMLTTTEIYTKLTEFAASLRQTLAICQDHGNETKQEQKQIFCARRKPAETLADTGEGASLEPGQRVRGR